MDSPVAAHPTITRLNGEFGVMMEHVTRNDLKDPTFRKRAYELWLQHGGLLVIRGDDLQHISPHELMQWSQVFGMIETDIPKSRRDKVVAGYPILRIGNVKDETTGQLVSQFSVVPPLASDRDMQYNPQTRRPVWHTDSTYRPHPPIGSVFHCREAPSVGGATLFADTRQAYERLEEREKRHLATLEAIGSLAHHDKKISLYSPGYPVLSQEERRANPPQRVPLVLRHPLTDRSSLYGLNSSTCAIVERGQEISQTDLDLWDLEGVEDDSVHIWRDLLPFVTSSRFTVKIQWQIGDIVLWDNRSTIHAATGFDHERSRREMWRLTLLTDTKAE